MPGVVVVSIIVFVLLIFWLAYSATTPDPNQRTADRQGFATPRAVSGEQGAARGQLAGALSPPPGEALTSRDAVVSLLKAEATPAFTALGLACAVEPEAQHFQGRLELMSGVRPAVAWMTSDDADWALALLAASRSDGRVEVRAELVWDTCSLWPDALSVGRDGFGFREGSSELWLQPPHDWPVDAAWVRWWFDFAGVADLFEMWQADASRCDAVWMELDGASRELLLVAECVLELSEVSRHVRALIAAHGALMESLQLLQARALRPGAWAAEAAGKGASRSLVMILDAMLEDVDPRDPFVFQLAAALQAQSEGQGVARRALFSQSVARRVLFSLMRLAWREHEQGRAGDTARLMDAVLTLDPMLRTVQRFSEAERAEIAGAPCTQRAWVLGVLSLVEGLDDVLTDEAIAHLVALYDWAAWGVPESVSWRVLLRLVSNAEAMTRAEEAQLAEAWDALFSPGDEGHSARHHRLEALLAQVEAHPLEAAMFAMFRFPAKLRRVGVMDASIWSRLLQIIAAHRVELMYRDAARAEIVSCLHTLVPGLEDAEVCEQAVLLLDTFGTIESIRVISDMLDAPPVGLSGARRRRAVEVRARLMERFGGDRDAGALSIAGDSEEGRLSLSAQDAL